MTPKSLIMALRGAENLSGASVQTMSGYGKRSSASPGIGLPGGFQNRQLA